MRMDSKKALTRPKGRRLVFVAALAATVVLTCLAAAAVAGATSVNQIWGTGTPTWQVQTAGSGISNDKGNAVCATSGGMAFVTGAIGNSAGNTDLSFSEIVSGVKKWTRTYNGGGADGGAAIALGLKGFVYTAGWTTNAAGNENILLIKWTTTGKRVWVRTYDGPKHRIDFATALTVDKYGNATVAGACNGTTAPAYSNIVVVNWSGKGAVRWAWHYAGTGHGVDLPTHMLAAKDGSVYMTGSAYMSGAKYEAITARFSLAGKRVWSRTYLGPDALGAVGNGLAACPAGGVYVGGGVSKAATGTDGMILRYTAAGSLKVLVSDTNGSTGTTAQWFNDIAVTTGGHVIAVGETEQNDASGDAYLQDYTSTGHATWPSGNIMAFGAGTQYFAKVVADSLGGYDIVGTEGSPTNIMLYHGSQNLGGIFWQSIWGNDASHIGANTASGIAVGGGTCWVVGTCATIAAGTDQIVLGFAN
jgi:hypothetical protein